RPGGSRRASGAGVVGSYVTMRVGDTIDHRFHIEREGAVGGMGRIYQARDLQTGQDVAVKVLGYPDPRARGRFLPEGRLLSEIRHPGIVRYVAHGIMSTGDPYLVMEWLEGENLAEYLERVYGPRVHTSNPDTDAPPAEAVRLD